MKKIAMTNDMSTLSAPVLCRVLRSCDGPLLLRPGLLGMGTGPAPPDKISRDEEEKQLQQLQQETRG